MSTAIEWCDESPLMRLQLTARHKTNYLVDCGILPDPDSVPCARCGHIGQDRRHEYHHHLGYTAEHRTDVVSLCAKCHRVFHPQLKGVKRRPTGPDPRKGSPGERNPAAILCWEEVDLIRECLALGHGRRELCRRFSMSYSQIKNIATGACWRKAQ